MSVNGPAIGMEQVDCVQLDEIVLEQSGCSMIAAGSPRGSPTSLKAGGGGGGGNSKDSMSNLELGAAAASGSEQWALGSMPVRPGTLILASVTSVASITRLTHSVCMCNLRVLQCRVLAWGSTEAGLVLGRAICTQRIHHEATWTSAR